MSAPARKPLRSGEASPAKLARRPVLAFVADADTEDAVRQALNDLAAAPGDIQRGGVEQAIRRLSDERSPEVLLIDLSGIDMPISEVHRLADVCEPGVNVIALGTRDHIGLYRDLLHAGVTDYLVKPVTYDLVRRSVIMALDGKNGAAADEKLGKLVAIAGTRGGVGTTTLATNLAWFLAERQSRRVALLDLDLTSGDCGLLLDLKPTAGLRQALEKPERIDPLFIERAMAQRGDKLFVLSAEEPWADDIPITADAVRALTRTLAEQFHYVVVDLPRSLRRLWPAVLEIRRGARRRCRHDLDVVARAEALAAVGSWRAYPRTDPAGCESPGRVWALRHEIDRFLRSGGQRGRHHRAVRAPRRLGGGYGAALSRPTRRLRRGDCRAGGRDFGSADAAPSLVEVTLVKIRKFGRRDEEEPRRALVPADAFTPAPIELAEEEIRKRMREMLMARIDPSRANRMERDQLQAEVNRLVTEIATEQRVQLNEKEENAVAAELLDDMVGLGPLEPLLRDDTVTDILVNGPNSIYVERRGKLEETKFRFRDGAHVLHVAQKIASAIGRHVDEASPMVDARLADGCRVNIIVPPLALRGVAISIRKFAKRSITLQQMADQGNLSPSMAKLLEIAAASRLNILISGGTGSGKTTLLNALSCQIDPRERIITIEDAAELQLQQPHVVSLETRPPSLEGTAEVSARDLLRNALRMRPDRIVVGEVRGHEAFDMMQAMNTGHDGSMSTIHANTPRDALTRLESMLLMSAVNLPIRAIRAQIVGALDLVVQVERMRDGIRRVTRVAEVVGLEGEIITMQDLFTFREEGETREGRITGTFESSHLIPHFIEHARHLGLEATLRKAMELEE